MVILVERQQRLEGREDDDEECQDAEGHQEERHEQLHRHRAGKRRQSAAYMPHAPPLAGELSTRCPDTIIR